MAVSPSPKFQLTDVDDQASLASTKSDIGSPASPVPLAVIGEATGGTRSRNDTSTGLTPDALDGGRGREMTGGVRRDRRIGLSAVQGPDRLRSAPHARLIGGGSPSPGVARRAWRRPRRRSACRRRRSRQRAGTRRPPGFAPMPGCRRRARSGPTLRSRSSRPGPRRSSRLHGFRRLAVARSAVPCRRG